MNTIKGLLLGISKVVLPLLAGIMCIGVLLIAGMSITYLSITGLLAITLYCLVPKTWGVIPLSVCVIAGCLYFYMLILSIFLSARLCNIIRISTHYGHTIYVER